MEPNLSKLVTNPKRLLSQWFVVRTNPNCEAKAKASLNRSGFGVYVPVRLVERQHKRTKAWNTKTYMLMPGYLFVQQPHGQPDWWTLRRCDGVKGVLGALNDDNEIEPFPISGRMVELVMAAQLNLEFDDTRASKAKRGEDAKSAKDHTREKFAKGSRVTVMDGPFASFLGRVEQVTTRGSIDVMVELFGRLTPIELSPEHVELLAA